mmetsp:Transcript_28722/g.73050  ORF Transcript_28722/g.73050 Transcript_28722/m.73050 type:complete len:284 (+) Transcript_28722:449-1300(+)
MRSDCASSSRTSPSLSRHPSAPAISPSCLGFLAPGMGSVPLQMHQLSATCAMLLPRSLPMASMADSRGATSLRRESLNSGARGPNGLAPPALYLPVSRPWHSGEYATSVTPASRHASSTPFFSGARYSRLYCTWLEARGMPAAASFLAAPRTRCAVKLDTPTASARPCCLHCARPSMYASLEKELNRKPGQCCMYSVVLGRPRRASDALQARGTLLAVRRQGRGANLVATCTLPAVPVSRRNSPRNSSLLPNPYTSAVSMCVSPASSSALKAALLSSFPYSTS